MAKSHISKELLPVTKKKKKLQLIKTFLSNEIKAKYIWKIFI